MRFSVGIFWATAFSLVSDFADRVTGVLEAGDREQLAGPAPVGYLSVHIAELELTPQVDQCLVNLVIEPANGEEAVIERVVGASSPFDDLNRFLRLLDGHKAVANVFDRATAQADGQTGAQPARQRARISRHKRRVIKAGRATDRDQQVRDQRHVKHLFHNNEPNQFGYLGICALLNAVQRA